MRIGVITVLFQQYEFEEMLEKVAAAGVTVVNVDNGFGAGVAASRINRRA